MKASSTHAFVNQLLVYTLVMICFSGSIGLGTVWMRHQISETANATKVLDAKIAELERRATENTAVIEAEQTQAVLLQRNAAWGLGLVNPTKEQFVDLPGDPVRRLAAKHNRDLFHDGAAPVAVSLHLAGLAP
ncbi:MAG TPA: hypothetical protein PLB90_10650 [Opitutaceae bacterium]|nr:hypothetical protein [Opitutaceae bacterium]